MFHLAAFQKIKSINRVDLNVIMNLLFLSVWVALYVAGLMHYSGSWLIYTEFSAVFLLMLISGFYRQVSYGYLFLVVMLWLGFWLKLTTHMLFDYPFGEPIGYFNGTSERWDGVLWVATVGSIGVLLARFLYGFTGQSSIQLIGNKFKAPAWYSTSRQWIWALVISFCVILATANITMGIQQSGLVPRTIMLWPLNALVYWLLNSGLSLAVATLLWWDIAFRKNISFVVYFVLFEAFTSTVSILSRGIYLFHVVPQFLGLYKNRCLILAWSRRNVIAMTMAFFVLFAISNPLVNSLRGYYYSNVLPTWQFEGGQSSALLRFAVDRWIGAEGVMAVSAYPKKGDDLFLKALVERGEIGKSTVYQEVCQSHYRFMDMKKFQFASLPGAMGFLYFTGHAWVVLLGMVLLVLIVLVSEGLVSKFTSNPLISALWGGVAANAVAQMGIAPRGLLIYFFEQCCGIAFICFIQSNLFSIILQKLHALISGKRGLNDGR